MANHIESLDIETYRGIKNLQIENLGDVNVFVGDNNTGKTSLLEAVQLLCAPNEYNLVQIARQREKYRASIRMGLSILDSVLFLFDVNNSSNKYVIKIGGKIHGEYGDVTVSGEVINQIVDLNELAKYSVVARNRLNNAVIEDQEEIATFLGNIDCTIGIGESSHLEINEFTKVLGKNNINRILKVRPVQTIDHIIANAFDKLIKNKEVKEQAVELLKEFDENITDIRYISEDNRFVPVIESANGGYIPLSLYGDGMKKALTMLNAMVNTEGGVVLVDEFETALHTSAMKKVFKFILDIAQQLEIQLFLTTHSIEAVDKLLESAGQYSEKVRIIRLKKKDGVTFAKVTKGDVALVDRREYNMELRV